MNWASILALIVEIIPSVPAIISAWNSPQATMPKVAAIVNSLSPAAQATLMQIAKTQFPKLAPAFGPAAALLQIAHPTALQYVQGGLNVIAATGAFTMPATVKGGQLTVDGLWGPQTTAAAEAAEAKAGIPITGAINDMLVNWIGGKLAAMG